MLAEDILVLMLDDRSGAPSTDATTLDYGLAGAVLVELSLAERLRIGAASRWRRAMVTVTDGSPTGNDVLDDALASIVARPGTAQKIVVRLAKGLRERLLDRLVDQEVLRVEHGRVLGVFPRKRWPAADTGDEDALRRALRQVLVGGGPADQRTAAVISVLASMDRAHKVLPDLDREARKQAKQRASALAEGDWASQGTRQAIKATHDATTAAIVAATVAATTAST